LNTLLLMAHVLDIFKNKEGTSVGQF
jgi:hypothetical protein